MTANNHIKKTFNFQFIEAPPKVVVELTNASRHTLKSIEILTIFLKDKETPGRGPSQAHIRFDGVKSMKPGEKTVLSHRTGLMENRLRLTTISMERLKLIASQANPLCIGDFVGGSGKCVFNGYRSATDKRNEDRLIPVTGRTPLSLPGNTRRQSLPFAADPGS